MGPKLSRPAYDLRIDFERYKDTYRQEIQKSISFIGQDLEFFTRVKVKNLLALTRRWVGEPSRLKILDVGCGVGITDHYLVPHFKKIYGVDLSRGVVRKAAVINPKASYRHYAGKKLPYPSNSMDVTFAICVMHHVPREGREMFIGEMARVTRPGGLIAVFEHNPMNPLTRCAVSRCDLDEDAVLLGPGELGKHLRRRPLTMVDKKYILFTPFAGRFFARLDRLLGWLPLGAQYYVAAKK